MKKILLHFSRRYKEFGFDVDAEIHCGTERIWRGGETTTFTDAHTYDLALPERWRTRDLPPANDSYYGFIREDGSMFFFNHDTGLTPTICSVEELVELQTKKAQEYFDEHSKVIDKVAA